MPAKKVSAASSKATTNTPRPRGRPAAKKTIKSSEYVDSEAEEFADTSDDDMKSVKSVTSTNPRPRPRPRPRPAGGRAKSVMAESDDGDDAASMKTAISANKYPRVPVTKAKSVRPTADDDAVDISSGDDAMSVVSTKSAKSTRSFMSVDDEQVTTPPRRSHSVAPPKTPVSSRSSSVNRKRSASLMVSPITDEESFEMMPSPSKSVRFKMEASSDTPLKGVLKKPEVVIPIKSRVSSSTFDNWNDDIGINAPSPKKISSSKKADVVPPKSRSSMTMFEGWDDDDTTTYDSYGLQSPFEDDKKDESTPKKIMGRGKTASSRFADDERDVFLEDYNTSVGPPDKDETDIGNRDPLLKSTYKGLPKIRAACARSWSHKPAQLPSYSGMLEEVPRINKRLFYEAIIFSGVRSILNLSRTDPAKISTGFGNQKHFHTVGGGGPLTFVSAIRVADCYLVEPKLSKNGKFQRLIEGGLIEGEWERLVGAIGQVIHQTDYFAQIAGGYFSFTTSFADSATPSTFNSSGNRRASGPNPFTKGPSSGNSTLSCHDIVPIYDARKYSKSFYELVPEIDQLQPINRELPPGSCAVVAYTINTWGASSPANVSLNIKWVALLGVPDSA